MTITIRPVSPALPPLAFGPTDFESVTGGVGGWETLDRPRRTAAAGWVGLPEKTATLPLILDGMEAGGPGVDRSVESAIATLESWGQPHRVTGEPPILQVVGVAMISPAERWVIQGIEFGAYVRHQNTGQRVQQEVTVTLLRYVAAQLVAGPAAKARARQKKKPAKKANGKRKGKKTSKGGRR